MSLDFDIDYVDADTGEAGNLYTRNITHNVSAMWTKAGIWHSLYDSEGKKPKDVIENLRAGLKLMETTPKSYRELEPDNGWGTYSGALKFLREVISMCARYPNATIGISR